MSTFDSLRTLADLPLGCGPYRQQDLVHGQLERSLSSDPGTTFDYDYTVRLKRRSPDHRSTFRARSPRWLGHGHL